VTTEILDFYQPSLTNTSQSLNDINLYSVRNDIYGEICSPRPLVFKIHLNKNKLTIN